MPDGAGMAPRAGEFGMPDPSTGLGIYDRAGMVPVEDKRQKRRRLRVFI